MLRSYGMEWCARPGAASILIAICCLMVVTSGADTPQAPVIETDAPSGQVRVEERAQAVAQGIAGAGAEYRLPEMQEALDINADSLRFFRISAYMWRLGMRNGWRVVLQADTPSERDRKLVWARGLHLAWQAEVDRITATLLERSATDPAKEREKSSDQGEDSHRNVDPEADVSRTESLSELPDAVATELPASDRLEESDALAEPDVPGEMDDVVGTSSESIAPDQPLDGSDNGASGGEKRLPGAALVEQIRPPVVEQLPPDEPDVEQEQTAVFQPQGWAPDWLGKMQWPVQGRVVASFGKRRTTTVPWQGILIAGRQGERVGAIHPGRVVFAGWQRGYGLVIIVNHGNDVRSVYGFNGKLLKNSGDIVQAGEPLAFQGRVTHHPPATLYLEIRQAGKAVDPLQWLRDG